MGVAEALGAMDSLVLAAGAADDFAAGLDSMADASGRGGCDFDVGVDVQAANASHRNVGIAFRGGGLMGWHRKRSWSGQAIFFAWASDLDIAKKFGKSGATVAHVKRWLAVGLFPLGAWACGTTNHHERVTPPVPTPVTSVSSTVASVPPVTIEPRLVGSAWATCMIPSSGHFSCWGRSRAAVSSIPVHVKERQITSMVFHRDGLLVTDTDGHVYETKPFVGFDKPATFVPRPDLAALKGLSCNGSTCCAIEDGRVVCWGSSTNVTQNKDAEKEPNKRVPIEGITNAIAVSTSTEHACAATSAGTVWCWGYNNYSQLGRTDRNSKGPEEVKGLTDVADVAVDYNISCARTKDGRIFCWGSNSYGSLGPSVGYESARPQLIAGIPPARRLGLEHAHVCASTDGGEVYCWGSNEYNRLGRQGLRESRIPLKVEGLNDIVDIALGMDHTCALHRDETVSCWGNRLDGRLGDGVVSEYHVPMPVPNLEHVKELCTSEYQWKTCAIRDDVGEVCWGDNAKLTEKRPSGIVACNNGNVLRSDGRVELEDGTVVAGVEQAVRFSTERSGGCALRQDGVVSCWHADKPAKVVLRDAKALAYSDRAACAVKTDGTLRCWGDVARRSSPTTMPLAAFGVSDVVTISMNTEGDFPSACVVHTDGTVGCWYWDLAIMEDEHLQLRKKAKPGITHAVAVDGGAEDGCAVLSDGRVQCWGDNDHGQLGDGTTEKRKEPVFVFGLSNASRVLVARTHRCVLHRDETVSCWGDNSKWDVGIPFDKTNWKPVRVKGLGPKK